MPTIEPASPPRKKRSHFPGSPVPGLQKPSISWNLEASEEEKQRRAFRLAMGLAFVKRPSRPDAVEDRAERILRAVFAWCVIHAENVVSCRVVLRGRHIDVQVFEPLREYDEKFGAAVSALGVELASLGVYATVLPIGLEEGQKPEEADDGGGDPVMVVR